MAFKSLARFSPHNRQPKPPRFDISLDRNVWLVLLSMAVIGFTIEGGIYSVLFNLFLLRLDYGSEFIGGFNGLGYMAYGIGALLGGFVGQRWGARRAMLLGISLLTLASLMIPIAPAFNLSVQTGIFVAIMIIRNVGTVLLVTGSTPYLMAFAKGAALRTAFAWFTAAFGIAAFAGATLGGMLPGWLSALTGLDTNDPEVFRLAFWLLPPLVFIGVLAIWRTEPRPPEAIPEQEAPVARLEKMPLSVRTSVIVFTLIAFLGGIGMSVANTFGVVYLDSELQLPTEWIGNFTGAASLIGVIGVLLLPGILQRWSLFRTTMTTYLCIALALALMALGGSRLLAGSSFSLVTALGFVRFTVYRMYTIAPIPPRFHNIVSGIYNAGVGIGFGVMSYISGLLIESNGYLQVFALGGIIVLSSALLFWYYEARLAPTPTLEPA